MQCSGAAAVQRISTQLGLRRAAAFSGCTRGACTRPPTPTPPPLRHVMSSTAATSPDPSSSPPPRLVLVVAAVLLDGAGRVLLAQRPPGKALAGLWEFPGGKVEAAGGGGSGGGDASPEAALVRELREELGLRVDPAALRPLTFASHAYGTFHLLMPTYACTEWEGEPQGVEGQALAWVDGEALRGGGYAMPPADLPLLPAVLAAMQQQQQQRQLAAVAGGE